MNENTRQVVIIFNSLQENTHKGGSVPGVKKHTVRTMPNADELTKHYGK